MKIGFIIKVSISVNFYKSSMMWGYIATKGAGKRTGLKEHLRLQMNFRSPPCPQDKYPAARGEVVVKVILAVCFKARAAKSWSLAATPGI